MSFLFIWTICKQRRKRCPPGLFPSQKQHDQWQIKSDQFVYWMQKWSLYRPATPWVKRGYWRYGCCFCGLNLDYELGSWLSWKWRGTLSFAVSGISFLFCSYWGFDGPVGMFLPGFGGCNQGWGCQGAWDASWNSRSCFWVHSQIGVKTRDGHYAGLTCAYPLHPLTLVPCSRASITEGIPDNWQLW